ncbi:MAG TPA: hypothetical protein ENI89_02325 [Desulfobulbus sp.]|nr:hypothetical protein [Desulfobulbus sp.]
MKQHLFIIVTIVIGFSSFMLGYSLPPFLEVGFGGGAGADMAGGVTGEAELRQQFEELYRDVEEQERGQ